MVTHTRISYSFNPSKVHKHTAVNTHSSEHTQQWHTPGAWAAIYAAARGAVGGSVSQGHLGHGIEGGENAVYSLPPTYNPFRPKTQTRNLSLMSPTL